MIIETPRDSPLRGFSEEKKETFHQDATTEALDMVRGILAALRCATYIDTGPELTVGEVNGAIEAALFLAELAQEHIDDWYIEK